MTALDSSAEYDDPDFLRMLADLQLADIDTPPSPPPSTPSPPPRTPSPRPPAYSYSARRTFPQVRPRTYTAAAPRSPVYHFSTPTQRGSTSEWSIAGSATQAVPHSTVTAIHESGSGRRKKKRRHAAAYIVFCGRRCGVFLTWDDTQPLVSGASSCIYRGYASKSEAEAAFAYAQARSWTRSIDSPFAAPIPRLPRPHLVFDAINPLSGSESVDDSWYIVYRGIRPGVYRSHLECQLNTLGIRGALHESVSGQSTAAEKYAGAVRRGDTRVILPVYEHAASDPFL